MAFKLTVNKKYLKYIIPIGLVFLMLTTSSCDSFFIDERLEQEEMLLDDFITESHPNATKLTNGLYFESIETHKDELIPEAGNYVLLNYTVADLDGNIERKSDDASNTLYNTLYKHGGPELWKLPAPLNGIFLAIGEMHRYDKADVFFSSRWNYFSTALDYKSRKITVDLHNVVNNITTYQEELMRNFVAANVYIESLDSMFIESPIDNSKDNKIYFGRVGYANGLSLEKSTELQLSVTYCYLLEHNKIKKYDSIEKQLYTFGDTQWPINTKYSSTDIIANILKKYNKGDQIYIALPYKLVYGKSSDDIPMDEETNQCIVPMNSVIILKIKIL